MKVIRGFAGSYFRTQHGVDYIGYESHFYPVDDEN